MARPGLKTENNNPGRSFTKFRERLYNIIDPKLTKFQYFETGYRSGREFWSAIKVIIDGEVYFEWPKCILDDPEKAIDPIHYTIGAGGLDLVIEQYLNLPKDQLFDKLDDYGTGLINIIRACDRRIGKRQLDKFLLSVLTDEQNSESILKILKLRGFDI